MEQREWTNRMDERVEWGPGPWQQEPDKMQFTDTDTGLPCLIVRGPFGALCGYVGIVEGHPWFGKGYSECILSDSEEEECKGGWCGHAPSVSVHGGLTFAALCSPSENEGRGICHVPGSGEPDRVWWFGFDCAHSGDFCPRDTVLGHRPFQPEFYRDIEYVKGEVASLARQLAEVK